MKSQDLVLTQDGSAVPIRVSVPPQIVAADLLQKLIGSGLVSSADVMLFRDEQEERIPDSEMLDVAKHDGVLHVARCNRVAVTIHYNRRSFETKVPPVVRLRRVRALAIKELEIPPADAATLVLQVTGTTEPLDPDTRVGSLAAPGICAVVLDLVPDSRIQG